MAEKTFDLDDSMLLCPEEGFDDLGTPTIKMDHLVDHKNPTPMISLPCLSEETFSLMIKGEKNHRPRYDYLERLRSGDLDPSVRKQALDWMLKVQAHHGFGELAFCLAMNYLDRIFSCHEIPKRGLHLLALACLSIGAKMAEIKVPSVLKLQIEGPNCVSDAKSVRNMELLVMKNLGWRMNPCTPFSFTDYFIRKMMMKGKGNDDDDKPPLISQTMITKSVELITSTIKGNEFLEFKASEIAAAVAMVVVADETHADDVEKEITGFIHVEKDMVMKCFKLLKNMILNEDSIGVMECIRIEIDIDDSPRDKRQKL